MSLTQLLNAGSGGGMVGTMSDKATVERVTRKAGIAGQVCYTAKVKYEGEPTSEVWFVGSEVYGGPVVMMTPAGVETFVTDPDRFGKFCAQWVHRFFGVVN